MDDQSKRLAAAVRWTELLARVTTLITAGTALVKAWKG
jgi:hypothetical protein